MSGGWIVLAVIGFFVLAPSAEERERGDRWRELAEEIELREDTP